MSEKSKSEFEKIKNTEDMIEHLEHSHRLNGKKYIYHYTTMDSALKIIKSNKWYLSNAKSMNDISEVEKGDSEQWKKMFMASFTAYANENIGMWSMYSLPWENGVQIQIPMMVFKDWIANLECLYEVKDNRLTNNKIEINNTKATASIVNVAYSKKGNSNSDETSDDHVLCYSSHKNRNFNDEHYKAFTGYVKNIAWAYEKEVRIIVDFQEVVDFEKIAIDVPKEVVEAITLIRGPLYNFNNSNPPAEDLPRDIAVKDSIFKGMLVIKGVNDSKKQNKQEESPCLKESPKS